MAIVYEDASPASVNRAAHVAACEAYADQVERLARSLDTRDPDVIAEALWAEDCPGQAAHPDHLVHLACDVQNILGDDTTEVRPEIPAWDLDVPPALDPAVERVMELLRADPNLCSRLRRELALLP